MVRITRGMDSHGGGFFFSVGEVRHPTWSGFALLPFANHSDVI